MERELSNEASVETEVLTVLVALILKSGPEPISVTVDGHDRTALIFLPSVPSEHPPVIFAFHGHGGNSRQASRSFGMQDAWPEAVVVYPQGLPTKSALVDPQGQFPGWMVDANDQNPDVRFFDALYTRVMKKVNGDPKRVFAMGHSNGGFFMYTLWAMRPDKFAAFGSAEAAGAGRFSLTPKPIFITIGSQDNIVPPALQRRSLNYVFKADGSSPTGERFGEKGTLYNGTAPVVVWNYDGTHTFPRDSVPSMVKFFQRSTRP